jgi:hypothetical protein
MELVLHPLTSNSTKSVIAAVHTIQAIIVIQKKGWKAIYPSLRAILINIGD